MTHSLFKPETMRRFDRAYLTPVEPLSADEIRDLRCRSGVSQSVFAMHLNVSPKTVESWESGAKRPSGATLKPLTLAKVEGLDYLR